MGGTAFRGIMALFALILLVGEVSGQAKSKPITTHLSAKWPDSPLLLETSEYMAEESLATFWGFVETIAEMDVNAYRESKSFYILLRVKEERKNTQDFWLYTLLDYSHLSRINKKEKRKDRQNIWLYILSDYSHLNRINKKEKRKDRQDT